MKSDNPKAVLESLFAGEPKLKSIDPLMLIELLYGKRSEEAGVTGGNTELPKSPASATSSFARLSPDLTPSQSSPFPVDVEVAMTKDDAYYHDYRVFLTENHLFQIPIRFLAAESEYFQARMDQNDGLTEENPIRLDSDVSPEDFRQLLRVLSPAKRFNAEPEVFSLSQWLSVLKLVKKWDMDEVRGYAISAIEKLPNVDPVDKIVLARTYDIPTWLVPSFNEILQRSQSLTESDIEKLGIPTTVRLVKLRDRLRPSTSQRGVWMLDKERLGVPIDFTSSIPDEFPECKGHHNNHFSDSEKPNLEYAPSIGIPTAPSYAPSIIESPRPLSSDMILLRSPLSCPPSCTPPRAPPCAPPCAPSCTPPRTSDCTPRQVSDMFIPPFLFGYLAPATTPSSSTSRPANVPLATKPINEKKKKGKQLKSRKLFPDD